MDILKGLSVRIQARPQDEFPDPSGRFLSGRDGVPSCETADDAGVKSHLHTKETQAMLSRRNMPNTFGRPCSRYLFPGNCLFSDMFANIQ